MSKNENLMAYNDMKQAEGLLRDKHLEWSSDFDAIRLDLADLLRTEAHFGSRPNPILHRIAKTLIATENTLYI